MIITICIHFLLPYRRALSSSSVDSLCAVINNACTLLEEDYSQVFKQQLKLGFPSGYLDLTQAYNVIQSSLQQGRLQASDTEKAKANFLVRQLQLQLPLPVKYDQKLCCRRR